MPNILDVINLINLLKAMRVKVDRLSEDTYRFQADDLDEDYISSADFVARCASLRGSVLVVGPLLARLGQAYFAKPGGDKIGRRRVDTHITGLSKLGAMIAYNDVAHMRTVRLIIWFLSEVSKAATCFLTKRLSPVPPTS